MPKTVINDAKGVVQSAGSGTTIANSVTHSGVSTLTGNVTFGVQSVAAAGSGTGDAAVISATSGTIVKVTGADNTTGVRLPTPTAGLVMFVVNTAAANTLPVYPETGGKINGASSSVNAAITVAAKGQAICIADGTYWWVSEPAVGS